MNETSQSTLPPTERWQYCAREPPSIVSHPTLCSRVSSHSRDLLAGRPLEGVDVILAHASKGVVDVAMVGLVCTHSQQQVLHGGVRGQPPVGLGDWRGWRVCPHTASINVLGGSKGEWAHADNKTGSWSATVIGLEQRRGRAEQCMHCLQPECGAVPLMMLANVY